jgi:choloylglycine hydrolase
MKIGNRVNAFISLILASCFVVLFHTAAKGCTGITLKAQNGAIVYGRTLEWGTFDLLSRLLIIPRGQKFVGHNPDGTNGITWTGKYGIAGIDVLEKPVYADAMNEKGLVAGLFYHPGFAEYLDYDPSMADSSMGPTDVMQYILSNYASVPEVKENIDKIRVVNVVEEALGFPPPIHLLVSDPTGEQIVIEWDKGKIKVFDAPLGVITNAPTYDWHMTNLRNYVNLSPVAIPAKKIEELDFGPLGGGSGMIGLPGDFTPPSRFIRAVAFTQTSRLTADGPETIYEIFRILDNFNVPLGAAEGSGEEKTKGMRSSTIWTSAHDLSNKVMYYHTQHSRQVRMVDVSKIDFGSLKEIMTFPLDKQKSQAIVDRTP